MKRFAVFLRATSVMIFAYVAVQSVAFAATNTWILPTSGDWHVATNWSLGILPDNSQSVRIDAPGWKAVAITPVTSANFPASLTVQNLLISNNSRQDLNTLLLNYAGTATPLRVLNGLAVQNAARIVNFNSALIVDSGNFVVTNAEVIQDGGLVRATNGNFYLESAAYYLTNGLFEAGSMAMAQPSNSVFNQYGGSATIRQLDFFGSPFSSGGGTYSLFGGQLTLQNLNLVSHACPALFVQSGGTNRSQQVTLSVDLSGGTPQYTLNGGLLETSNTVVFTEANSCRFEQNGGIHHCTHLLSLQGGLRTATVRPGSYFLLGGQLAAPTVQVRSYGAFIQSNGLASVSGDFQLVGAPGDQRWSSSLAGGTLACSNLLSSGAGGNFEQTGGALIVTNLFSFGGAPACCGPNDGATYTFSGGTITASNIQIGIFSGGTNTNTKFILGSSALSGRITNPGNFSLAGILRAGDANEQFGRFILGASSTLDLGSGSARLRFAASSGQAWNANAILSVTNWAGSTNGGGNDQLKFGNNASGLSASQLRQIVFSNPAGFAAGNYSAQILATGEIVPATGTSLGATHSGTNLVLNWPAGWFLQSATNVVGPYVDVPAATSPYTNQLTGLPQQYFRLRR